MINFIKNTLINAAGALIGYAEMIGLKYPVKHYKYQVSDVLWRGSRLTNTIEYNMLAMSGIKSIINLCAENDMDSKPAKTAGLKTIHIKIMDNQPPKEYQMIEFLNFVLDQKNQPAYVHCEAGKGRTGVAVACYRMAAQCWLARDAIKEAKEFGMAMPDQEEFLLKFENDLMAIKVLLKGNHLST